jgi:hypothetical protein
VDWAICGNAYHVANFWNDYLRLFVVVVPIRSGVALRLGANVGYLKFTPESTSNPF